MGRRGLFHRRAFMKAIGAGAITLPFLHALRAEAQACPTPKRLIVYFVPHGVVEPNFWPSTTTGAIGTLPDNSILKPLDAFKDRMLVLRGLDNQPGLFMQGDPSYADKDSGTANCTRSHGGCFAVLTGHRVADTSGSDLFGAGESCEAGTALGKSLDQVVADHVGFPAYLFGVQRTLGGISEIFNGGGNRLALQNDPRIAFTEIFQNIAPQDPAELERLLLRRQSILDYVKDDLAALHGVLGSEDRIRLEAHLDAIAALEQNLVPPQSCPLDACTTPTMNFAGNEMQDDLYPVVGDLQMNLMVMALACDLRRVVGLEWGPSTFHWMKDRSPTDPLGLDIPVTSTIASTIDSYNDHHILSHSQEAQAAEQEALTAIKRWYARQLARLVEKLHAIPEGAGTMLDNTLIVWCTEIRKGNHQNDSTPFVLLGNVDGYFNTGRQVVYAIANGDDLSNQGIGNGVPHNNLLVSICQAFGVPLDTVDGHANFGDPRFCTGPLPNLT